MKGYIYTMFRGADPANGWVMTDPIPAKIPTMGACMPNIRQSVTTGDYIFSISGRVEGKKQYIVGGFQVDRKLNALAALEEFPENGQEKADDGTLRGNIIFNADGSIRNTDYHTNPEKRTENYVVGKNGLWILDPETADQCRDLTLSILQDIFKKKGSTVYDIIGRWRKLDSTQIQNLYDNIKHLKGL